MKLSPCIIVDCKNIVNICVNLVEKISKPTIIRKFLRTPPERFIPNDVVIETLNYPAKMNFPTNASSFNSYSKDAGMTLETIKENDMNSSATSSYDDVSMKLRNNWLFL